jgi:hypothetical protein
VSLFAERLVVGVVRVTWVFAALVRIRPLGRVRIFCGIVQSVVGIGILRAIAGIRIG